MLRLKIWSTLRALASSGGSTVVITTHYMEEAARADRVGFVRAGRMLREGAPSRIKAEFGSGDLDAAFFTLCQRDSAVQEEEEEKSRSLENSEVESETSTTEEGTPLIPSARRGSAHGRREAVVDPSALSCFLALCFKNVTVLRRNVVFMSFQAIMPVVTFLVFIACIGPPLRDLRLSVYNGEGRCDWGDADNASSACPLAAVGEKAELGLLSLMAGSEPSLGKLLSCRVLSQFDPEVFGSVVLFATAEEAEAAVTRGESDAVLHFQPDFSSSLAKRVLSGALAVGGASVSESALSGGAVRVRLDATDATVASSVQRGIVRGMRAFLVGYAENCSLPELGRLLRRAGGVDFETTAQELVLGGEQLEDTILSHDMLPGMMAIILQMLAMALTSDLLIKEKENGLLLRDLVCGVSLTAALLANLLCMLIVVVFQIGFSVVLLALVSPQVGPRLLSALTFMFLLHAVCGMTLGLLITAICRTAEQAIQVGFTIHHWRGGISLKAFSPFPITLFFSQTGISLIFPSFLLSGVLWPRVSMPFWLSAISAALPSTISCDVVRAVAINRTLDVPMVVVGYLMPVMWAMIFFLAAIVLIKRGGYKV